MQQISRKCSTFRTNLMRAFGHRFLQALLQASPRLRQWHLGRSTTMRRAEAAGSVIIVCSLMFFVGQFKHVRTILYTHLDSPFAKLICQALRDDGPTVQCDVPGHNVATCFRLWANHCGQSTNALALQPTGTGKRTQTKRNGR